MRKIIIVGAGASGVYLSILLKQELKENADVIVLEQNTSPLKKLLATGNGRCNLSNQNMSIDFYQSDHQDLVEDIISSFDMKKQMNEIGLLCEYQGTLLYPKSEQALSVKRVMMDKAESLGVLFFYEQEVIHIDKNNQYVITTTKQTFHCDDVIIAMGSEAGKLSGIKNTRYQILRDLKLKVITPTPSLVQMKTQPILKQLKGVRVKGTFRLLENHQCIHQEKGELLFTDYGVSGIAVMQLSSFYREGHQYEISIDLFDDVDVKNLHEYIASRQQKDYNHFYDGIVHSKLSSYLESLNLQTTDEIVHQLKDMRLKITGLQDYQTAQVMKGGLSLEELDCDLQVKKYPHMYAMGEICHVAGMCGGYNLHFAFASAYRIYQAIRKETHVKNS